MSLPLFFTSRNFGSDIFRLFHVLVWINPLEHILTTDFWIWNYWLLKNAFWDILFHNNRSKVNRMQFVANVHALAQIWTFWPKKSIKCSCLSFQQPFKMRWTSLNGVCGTFLTFPFLVASERNRTKTLFLFVQVSCSKWRMRDFN